MPPAPVRIALLPLVLACGARTDLPVPESEDVPAADAAVANPDLALEDARVRDAMRLLDMCTPFRTLTMRAPLDVHLVVDSSGSMREATASGVSKAVALDRALARFLSEPGSDDVRASVTLFPRDGIPGGPGELRPQLCEEDEECEGDPCVRGGPRIGVCTLDGIPCRLSDVGRDPCTDRGTGLCVDRGVCGSERFGICSVTRYSTPDLGPLAVPGGSDDLSGVLVGRLLGGGTPSAPALQGVLSGIQERAADSKSVVIFATDGFPAQCFAFDVDSEITRTADIAAAGASRGVPTYVLGVFAQNERSVAEARLSRIAEAGGSGEAIVVSTDAGDVSAQLTQVLRDIRAQVQRCAFRIPASSGLPDPRDLSVRLVGEGGMSLERVPSCAESDSGYFVAEEGEGGRPTTIELCEAACTAVERDDLSVELEADCLI